jgi:cytoskeleton protein RodZ
VRNHRRSSRDDGPQSMSDFGGKLRLARERRGISLRQLSASTKISIAALEALERNDMSKLPGGIFSKAFVRSYALEVGLDPDETAREFLERFHGGYVPPVAAPAAVSDEDSRFETQQRVARVVLKLALISVPLIGIVLYFTMRSHPVDRSVAAEVSTSAPPPIDSPARQSTGAASVPAAPAVPPPRPPVEAAASRPMTLELHPTGECWIKLTVDGQPVLSRLMLAGEKEVRQIHDIAVIEVGNAGAFAFSVDGRPGKSLGQPGQVRTARITKETLAQYLE